MSTRRGLRGGGIAGISSISHAVSFASRLARFRRRRVVRHGVQGGAAHRPGARPARSSAAARRDDDRQRPSSRPGASSLAKAARDDLESEPPRRDEERRPLRRPRPLEDHGVIVGDARLWARGDADGRGMVLVRNRSGAARRLLHGSLDTSRRVVLDPERRDRVARGLQHALANRDSSVRAERRNHRGSRPVATHAPQSGSAHRHPSCGAGRDERLDLSERARPSRCGVGNP